MLGHVVPSHVTPAASSLPTTSNRAAVAGAAATSIAAARARNVLVQRIITSLLANQPNRHGPVPDPTSVQDQRRGLARYDFGARTTIVRWRTLSRTLTTPCVTFVRVPAQVSVTLQLVPRIVARCSGLSSGTRPCRCRTAAVFSVSSWRRSPSPSAYRAPALRSASEP